MKLSERNRKRKSSYQACFTSYEACFIHLKFLRCRAVSLAATEQEQLFYRTGREQVLQPASFSFHFQKASRARRRGVTPLTSKPSCGVRRAAEERGQTWLKWLNVGGNEKQLVPTLIKHMWTGSHPCRRASETPLFGWLITSRIPARQQDTRVRT